MMEHLKLAAAMTALLAVIGAVILLASPYDPVVAACVPIEELWEIEDSRSESPAPLVTALACNGVPLAYDREENTFYCTLGLEQGSQWPELKLTAPGAGDVSLCFSDDYTFDSCADAIRNGFSYELMAYTRSEYAYFNLVFTGLPLVCIETAAPITREDGPVQITISAFAGEPVVSSARAHIRGDSSASHEKASLTIEFTRSEAGKRRIVDVPGIGQMHQLILNSMSSDETLLKENLSWALYDEMLGEDYAGALDARRTQYCELFTDGEYRGLYLMMEPVIAEEELQKEGGSAVLSDSLYRTLVAQFAGERPCIANSDDPGTVFELRYNPPRNFGLFSHLNPISACWQSRMTTPLCKKRPHCLTWTAWSATAFSVRQAASATMFTTTCTSGRTVTHRGCAIDSRRGTWI